MPRSASFRHRTLLKILAKYSKEVPPVDAFTVESLFGGWARAQKEQFDDGATFDQVIAAAKSR